MLISKGEMLLTSDAVMCAVLCQSVRMQNKGLSSFLSPFKDSDNEIFSLFTDLDIAVLLAIFSFLSFSCTSSFSFPFHFHWTNCNKIQEQWDWIGIHFTKAMAIQVTGSKKSFTYLHGARDVVVVPAPAVPTRLPREPAQPRLDCGQPWAKSSNGDQCVTVYLSWKGMLRKCQLCHGHLC